MAQKIQIILEDDIDGGEATQTVTFGLDGTTYEIDVNDANAERIRSAFAPFVGHARKVTGSAGKRSVRKAAADGPSASEVRDWARANGYTVPDRGRIPADVRSAYDAAH